MLKTIDWQKTVHDPRFWAVRYGCHGDYLKFPGVTWKESLAWYKNLVGHDQDLQRAGTEEEMEEGWTLSLSFPEDYSWQMDYTTEDEMDSGTYHSLHHPTTYPQGLYVAVEGPDDHLPGLRWAELKQIEASLMPSWQVSFDKEAHVPLLYPIVEHIAFAELEEVRQTLATAWQDLLGLDAMQAEQWLDQIMEVYEQGQVLRMNDQREWIPTFNNPRSKGEDFWVHTEKEGWKTTGPTSLRNIRKEAHHFLPFFSMLERSSSEGSLKARERIRYMKGLGSTSASSPERQIVLLNWISAQISDEQKQRLLQAFWGKRNEKELKADQVEELIAWAKEDDFVSEVEAVLSLLQEE